MMLRYWLWSALIGAGLLQGFTGPCPAGGETDVRRTSRSETCSANPPASDHGAELPSCASPDEAMDVIRIPPVVILGDRPTSRQFEPRHDPEFRKYLKQVRKRIDQEKAYPFTAQQMRWEGSTMITFTVSPFGELLQTRIARTSGFLILDEAAETAVKKAFPVVPPKDLFEQPMEFKVSVMFELH
jgi:TonB family protein